MRAGSAASVLRPASVAIVGASERARWPSQIYTNLRDFGYAGRVVLINPRQQKVFGKDCLPSLRNLSEPVDHAMVIVPATHVPGVLADAEASGVKSATVYAAAVGDGEGEASRHVLDVGVQATVLVDDEDARELLRVGRPDEIAFDFTIPLGRGHGFRRRADARVVGLDLDRPGVVRLQHLEQRRGARPADGELLGACEERAPAHAAVHVDVEQVQQFLREVRRLLSAHGIPLRFAAWPALHE